MYLPVPFPISWTEWLFHHYIGPPIFSPKCVHCLADVLRDPFPNGGVSFLRLLRAGRDARSDGPNGLIGDDHLHQCVETADLVSLQQLH